MNPLLEQFVAEAAELLAQVDEGLLRLEQHPDDVELINAVFRAAHTFKGSSGLFELPELTRLTHAAEDLLDEVRLGSLPLTGTMVDDLLAAFDAVRNWMGAIADTGTTPADAGTVGAALAARLRTPLGLAGPVGSVGPAALEPIANTAPAWLLDLGPATLRPIAEWLGTTGSTIRAFRYRPDENAFFRGEDPVSLLRQLPALEAVDLRPVEPWGELAEFDEYRCLLQITALTRAGLGEVRYVLRYVEEQADVVEVSGLALLELIEDRTSPQASGNAATVPGQVAAAATILAAQRALVAALHAESTSRPEGAAAPAVLRSALLAARGAVEAAGGDPAGAVALLGAESIDPADALAWLDAAGDTLPTTPPDPATAGRLGPVAGADGPVSMAGEAGAADGGERAGAPISRILKVDQAKIDHLLDLVGELVVAKNSLPFVATEAEESGARLLARRIKDEYAVVSRIVEELQQSVMDVRMLPVSVAFARLPRMVRDLSRRLHKEVRLVTEGEDAAADKDVIEMLGEPLVHLVRNSLDHGIEPPAERVSAGKPAEAVLELRATQDGDAVVVEIRDDGRGVNADAVRRKAYERGLITESELEAMPDDEAVQLIFAPGFSTAAAISDVSGRGVGMDAVKSAVEGFGGSVAVRSRPGLGTSTVLRLPLTMAVSRVLVASVDGQRFGVPVESVVETVRLRVERINSIAGREAIMIRDEVIPLVDLGAALGLAATDRNAAEVNVLVVRTPTGPAGLLVEQFAQNMDVIIKPLEGFLSGTPGYAGTAMLGDGLVLLVLDVKELIDRAVPVG